MLDSFFLVAKMCYNVIIRGGKMLKKLEELKNKYNQLTKEIEKFACENKH